MLTPSSIAEPSRESAAENASWEEGEPLTELLWLAGVDLATIGDARLALNIGWANLRVSERPASGVEAAVEGFEPAREINRLSFLDLISEAGRGMFCGAIVSGRGSLRSDGVSDGSKPGGMLNVPVRNVNDAPMRLVNVSKRGVSAQEPHTMRRTSRNIPGSWSICGNLEVGIRSDGAIVVV